MPVNEVDLFTIVMGKAVEHHTKALASEKVSRERIGSEPRTYLSAALQEMAAFVQHIQSEVEQVAADRETTPVESLQQLVLFALESGAQYEDTLSEGDAVLTAGTMDNPIRDPSVGE
jgi:uncharacterized protein YicC (UPF0701 family)